MEYKGLKKRGLFNTTIEELFEMCVLNFSENDKRKKLFENFQNQIIKPLKETREKFQIWVDGSFLTKKARTRRY